MKPKKNHPWRGRIKEDVHEKAKKAEPKKPKKENKNG